MPHANQDNWQFCHLHPASIHDRVTGTKDGLNGQSADFQAAPLACQTPAPKQEEPLNHCWKALEPSKGLHIERHDLPMPL